ncbi:hypothetical protein F2Q69_00003020 [Brassica cretica]|uniref:Phospholipid/glycerol acyltransferase domain-containing protein n=1 Tax=Brassica cretica TaxID=69181 RepID=A0A8S9NMH1_BRACR|nr:hypothetical protein F2Q69_00003020 [Brassica cretica]
MGIQLFDKADLWKSLLLLKVQLRDRFRIAVDDQRGRAAVLYTDGYFSSSIHRLAARFRNFRRESLPSAPAFYRRRVPKDLTAEEESAIFRMLQAVAVPLIGNACHVFMNGLNRVQVYGLEKLHDALLNRPKNKPLVTVSNHVASLDDPFVIASLLPPKLLLDARNLRWTLCATDRCFKNPVTSAFFRSVKVLPVSRGEGIYQQADLWKSLLLLKVQLRDRFRIAVDDQRGRAAVLYTDGYFSSSIHRLAARFRNFRRESLPSAPAFYRRRVPKDLTAEEESAIFRMLQAVAVPLIGNACHVFMNGLNRVQVYGLEKLHDALLNRPKNKPLVTVSNHVASLDDPFVIASLLPPKLLLDARNLRWTLCATDRCFKNPVTSTRKGFLLRFDLNWCVMGLGNKVNKFNFGDNDHLPDEGGGGEEGDGFGSVACSICLDTVAKDGDRAWANLQCGHQFHLGNVFLSFDFDVFDSIELCQYVFLCVFFFLDCIGSAFNAKGVMQCPNCRKVEKGQWLYANGCRSHPEFNVEDWVHEEEIYDIGSYPEMVKTLSLRKLSYVTVLCPTCLSCVPRSKTLVFMYLCRLLEFTGAHLEAQLVFPRSSQ